MRQKGEEGGITIDTLAFENLEGRLLRTIGEEEISKANTKVELISKIRKKFFRFGRDYSTSTGKTISEVLAERLESDGKVRYLEDFIPKEYRIEVIKNEAGVPDKLVVRQYLTSEKANQTTAYTNQHRAELADRRLQQNLPQLGFLRIALRSPLAPRVINPSNFRINEKGNLQVQYITKAGLLKMYSPRQIAKFMAQREKPFTGTGKRKSPQ